MSGDSKHHSALLSVLKDLVTNSCVAPNGRRYSRSTLDLFSIVAVRSMKAAVTLSGNLGGPTEATMRSHVRAHRRNIVPGFDADGMKQVAVLYAALMSDAGLAPGSVPVLLAEDETACTGTFDYDVATCCVYGSCGLECADHRCDSKPIPFSGAEPDGFERLRELFRTHRKARCKF